MAERSPAPSDRAAYLASQLLSMVREYVLPEAELRVKFWVEGEPREPEEGGAFFNKDNRALRELVELLDQELEEVDFHPKAPVSEAGRWAALPVGYIRVTLALRPIHRGYLQPTKIVPIAMQVTERVAAFLITLPGDDHLLYRDNHGFRWHYHYVNAEEEHSDTILCWDTRATLIGKSKRPIFQEKHASGFLARPDLWGYRKKQTMHEAAYPDLATWSLGEFRCASNKSQPVWPLGARLSSVPTKASVPPKHPAKPKKQRRR